MEEKEAVMNNLREVKVKISRLEELPKGDPERARLLTLEQQQTALEQRLTALEQRQTALVQQDLLLLQQSQAAPPVPTKEEITAARRARIKAEVDNMTKGHAFSVNLMTALQEDQRETGHTNLYVAVAGALPVKDVLGAASQSSNRAAGSISPTEVYLSLLDPQVLATELWPLWDSYIPTPPDYFSSPLTREEQINAKMSELMGLLVSLSMQMLVSHPRYSYGLNLGPNSQGGIVDLKGVDYRSDPITTVDHEGKTQRVLSLGPDNDLQIQSLIEEYYNGPAAVANDVLPGICGYCHWDGTSHGIISSYASTTYIRFIKIGGTAQQPQYGAFLSQTVLDTSTGFTGSISTAMLIVYAALCSVRQRQLTKVPEKHAVNKGIVYKWMPPKTSESSTRGPAPVWGLSAGGAIGQKSTTCTQGKTCSTNQHSIGGDVTLDLQGMQLTLLDQVVGRGLNGGVRAGRWHGLDIVVKSAGLDLNACRLAELEQECRAYAALEELQGVCVPFMHGTCYTPTTLYLVLERVWGHHTHDLDAVAPPAQRKHAFEALSQLHSAGWLHGDLRSANVMLVDKSDKVMLIDLGRAERRDTMSDEAWQRRKMEECRTLESIMGCF